MAHGATGTLINPSLLVPELIGPEPDPVPCPFCGRLLHYRDMGVTEDGHIWSMLPEDCTCDAYQQDLVRMADESKQWEAEEKQRRENEMYDQLLDETLYGSGLDNRGPYTFGAYQPGTPEQRDALGRVQRYVQDFDAMLANGTGLMLCGPNGTGKTHLASACIQALHRAGYHGLIYRSAPQMTSELRSAWDHQISETSLMHAYTTAPLLVIDDLGKQSRADYVQRYLFEILDARYSHNLPTIVTTNASPSTLAHSLGTDRDVTSAVISRLVETVICIAVTGQDYRKRRHIRRVHQKNDIISPNTNETRNPNWGCRSRDH